MFKKITITTVITLLVFSFFASYGQRLRPEYYYIVTLRGDIVSNILNTYPQFAYFDFSYKRLESGKYSVTGYAKDADNNQLGDEIDLIPMTDKPARSLKNLDNTGTLRLDKETMQQYDVDGSEDYILTPRKCKDHSGQLVDYVSYRFNNKIDDSDDSSTGSLTTVKVFTLNPSPPY